MEKGFAVVLTSSSEDSQIRRDFLREFAGVTMREAVALLGASVGFLSRRLALAFLASVSIRDL